jgi:hypothetical protein
MDYSCADEIVAKLLLRYAAEDRPVNAYFLARGLQAHHLEAVHAVLDRHGLLLAGVVEAGGAAQLIGPCTQLDRSCWSLLLRQGRSRAEDLAVTHGLPLENVAGTLRRFVEGRVAVSLSGEVVCALPKWGEG